MVRESGLDWTIIRPSIIAGHSETGEIASFQGFHLFIATILKGRLPIIPVAPQTPCDFVAVDWVADAIARIVEQPEWGRTYWLTAGAKALTIEDMMKTGRNFASARGRDLDRVELMTPQAVEDQILPDLKPRSRERLSILINLAKVMARRTAFPSDLNAVDQAGLKRTLLANLDYWGTQSG